MRKNHCIIKQLLVFAFILLGRNTGIAQSAEKPVVNEQQAKVIVSDIIRKFSDYFLKGDSVALSSMYTKDASLGAVKGKDVPAAIGKMICSSIQDNSRHITYTSTLISVDGEFIIEVGTAEGKDDRGNHKWISKYLVVYKQENGNWKLYGDIGL